MNKKFLIAIIFGIFLISLVSAGFDYDNYILKWQLCNALNMTETICDEWWGAIADFPEEIVGSGTNETRVIQIIDERLYYYYNMSQTDWRINLVNISGVTKEQLDNVTMALRDSFAENYVEKTPFELLEDRVYGTNRSGSDNTNYILIGGIILGIILIGVFVFKKQQNPTKIPVGRVQVSKIPKRIELEQQEEIERLKKEKEELEKKSKENKEEKPEENKEEEEVEEE